MDGRTEIYLAPFQGITGAVFRDVYTTHFKGINKLFTPFFAAIHSKKSLSAKVAELEKTNHNKIPVVPQILSNDPEEIKRFSLICADMGFKEVNWNLGCPFRRVASKRRGSGLMPYPKMVNEILDKVMPSVPLDFSIKCRLGYESPSEILEMLKVFNQFPLSELTVHARLGRQIYKGEVDLLTFDKITKQTLIPLIYNGDVFKLDDFQKFKERFSKIDKWMIGRGLLTDPFLPADIKNFSASQNLQERKVLVQKFIEDLYFQYRKKLNNSLHTINLMKEFWGYLAFSFNNPVKVFGLIKKTKSFDEYEDALKIVFSENNWLGANGKQSDE